MMSKEKRRVPKLRFPGFTEDWEQRKLNEFLSVSNLKNTENKYNKKDVLSVSGDYGIVNQIEFQGRSFAGVSVSNYGVVEKGDIVYTKSPLKLNPYGIIKTNRINNGIVSTLYAIYKTKENCDSKFIEHYFNLDSRLNQYLKPLVNKGAKNDMKVSSENALVGEVCFPQITEQAMIADLLDRLDIYITLHQRKLDNLKLKKKTLLQKLFPKNGERYPELRFPGFTDAWEQRKLSDISTKVTTKNVDVHYTETLTNSAEQGIISQVDFFDKEISNKDNINGYYIVENNDFIYNPRISTLAPVGPINRNKLNRTGIMSPLYTVFRASKVDLGFLEWYFQSNHWHRYMKLNGDSGARADRIAIKDSTFFDMPIKTPVNIKEQVLIGETLEKFNQYITLHQRKLDHLQLQKKALLQQMFV